MKWVMVGPGMWQSGKYTAVQSKHMRDGWDLFVDTEKVRDAKSLKEAKRIAGEIEDGLGSCVYDS